MPRERNLFPRLYSHHPLVSRCCDKGESIFDLESPAAASFASVAEKVSQQVESFKVLEEGCLKNFDLRSIQQNDPHRFTIEWTDGKLMEYRCSDLQRMCPCAACCDIDPDAIAEDVEALRIVSVGKYALQIYFSKGCSKGIYPFELLRNRGKIS